MNVSEFVSIAGLALLVAWPVAANANERYPVAGLAPQARPAGAPTISSFERTAAWRANALKGVSEPYPPSLNFLDNQGAWYTPFSRPGMPTPYDLRGLHASGATATASKVEKNK
jgi:hypothetical protein